MRQEPADSEERSARQLLGPHHLYLPSATPRGFSIHSPAVAD